jgi:hypothetical protein
MKEGFLLFKKFRKGARENRREIERRREIEVRHRHRHYQ